MFGKSWPTEKKSNFQICGISPDPWLFGCGEQPGHHHIHQPGHQPGHQAQGLSDKFLDKQEDDTEEEEGDGAEVESAAETHCSIFCNAHLVHLVNF